MSIRDEVLQMMYGIDMSDLDYLDFDLRNSVLDSLDDVKELEYEFLDTMRELSID